MRLELGNLSLNIGRRMNKEKCGVVGCVSSNSAK